MFNIANQRRKRSRICHRISSLIIEALMIETFILSAFISYFLFDIYNIYIMLLLYTQTFLPIIDYTLHSNVRARKDIPIYLFAVKIRGAHYNLHYHQYFWKVYYLIIHKSHDLNHFIANIWTKDSGYLYIAKLNSSL